MVVDALRWARHAAVVVVVVWKALLDALALIVIDGDVSYSVY